MAPTAQAIVCDLLLDFWRVSAPSCDVWACRRFTFSPPVIPKNIPQGICVRRRNASKARNIASPHECGGLAISAKPRGVRNPMNFRLLYHACAHRRRAFTQLLFLLLFCRFSGHVNFQVFFFYFVKIIFILRFLCDKNQRHNAKKSQLCDHSCRGFLLHFAVFLSRSLT